MGKAVVSVAGESGAPGGVAHRGRLLKMDLDASDDFDGFLGTTTQREVVVLQAATGRTQGSYVGAGVMHVRPTRPTGGRPLTHLLLTQAQYFLVQWALT